MGLDGKNKLPRLLTPEEVSRDILRGRITVKTLAMRRWKRQEPRFVKLGGRVFYDYNDIMEWLEKCKIDCKQQGSVRGGKK